MGCVCLGSGMVSSVHAVRQNKINARGSNRIMGGLSFIMRKNTGQPVALLVHCSTRS